MELIEELRWRGLIHNITAGTEELLQDKKVTAYLGIDPTAPSLHLGNLATLMLLLHLQRAGHKPLALIGGATALIGDPSGKSEERDLMAVEEVRENQSQIAQQLEQFLDFDTSQNTAKLLNNYDWYKDQSLLPFLRDVGKHLPIRYLMAKESVKNRLEQGLSFTEFSYQLLQAYDFYYLFEEEDCVLQVGGSDQWGNMTSGVELIRRKLGGEAYALTCPLLTKPDGTKFGKTEEGNVWLDPEMTSPYKFYQFWINISDEEAKKYIRLFTLKEKNEIESLVEEHEEAPYKRVLQKALAEEVTQRVHSKDDYELALKTTEVLFGKDTTETLKSLSEKELLQVFEGVPQFKVSRQAVENDNELVPFLADESGVFDSRGEVKRSIKNNALRINKQKVQNKNRSITSKDLLNDKYLIVQKGKKNYNLVIVE
jgi:tyrosyl-tRNA synthetase